MRAMWPALVVSVACLTSCSKRETVVPAAEDQARAAGFALQGSSAVAHFKQQEARVESNGDVQLLLPLESGGSLPVQLKAARVSRGGEAIAPAQVTQLRVGADG